MENKKSERNKNQKYFFRLFLFFGSLQIVSYLFYLEPNLNWVLSDFIILFVISTPIVSLLVVWLINYFNAQYPEEITWTPKHKLIKSDSESSENDSLVSNNPTSNYFIPPSINKDLIEEKLEIKLAKQRTDDNEPTITNPQSATPFKNLRVQHNNWEAIQKLRLQIGEISEILVYSMERKRLTKLHGQNNFKLTHVARTLNTFPGYDILSQNMDGSEKYIEVKGTISDRQDNFVLSENEYKAFLANENNYFVYRVYDLNMATGAFSVSIYNGQELQDLFDKIPQSFQLKLKA